MLVATDARERYVALLRGEEPDRVPVLAADNLRSGPPGGWVRRLVARGLGLYPIAHAYAPSFAFPGFTLPTFPDVTYQQRHYSEADAQFALHALSTPIGEVTSLTRQNPLNLSVEATIVEHFVKEPRDWKVFTYLFRQFTNALHPTYEEVALTEDTLGGTGLTAVLAERTPYQRAWIELASMDRTFMDVKQMPEEFLEFLEGQRALHERAAEIIAGSPAELVLIIDNITNIISPKYYRDYCLPYYQIYADAMRDSGKPLGVHMDGLLAHLKAEIAASPLQLVESLTVPPSGDIPLPEAKAAWPGKAIAVNCPPHLAWAEPEAIREAYSEMLQTSGDRRFAVVHIEDLPPERVELHLAAALDAFGYPC